MKREEDSIHIAIVQYLAAVAPDVLVYHPANGGYRTKAEAGRLKAMGVLAGIPDVALVLPGGKAAFIEVKTAKGTLSTEQKAIRLRMIRRGIPCITARSIEDVRIALEMWNVVTREAP